ncbi:MAG: Omp28-related outer membrane protein [Saprospiraceae bacterium]|nr:Omp28-related outer membrane protein [Saprospiraceae bacterium]
MMKKLYLSLFLILPFVAQAQFAKYELVEWFTNTWCPICSGKNPALRIVYNQYSKLHRITIHPSVPYPQCPLYNFNKEDNEARKKYYGISGTPTLFINGIRSSNSAGAFESDLQQQQNQVSPVAVEVIEQTGSSRSAKITIKSQGGVPDGSYKLFVALLEQSVDLTANNGETEHYDVLRNFLSSAEGDDFQMPAVGQSTVLDYEYSVPDGVNPDKAYVLAFVQEVTSRAILNSGTKFDEVTTSLTDVSIEAELKAFPNPASDLIHVTVGKDYRIYGIEVLNHLGQKLRSLSIEVPENTLSIPVNDLPLGTYLVQVDLGNKKGIVRFIKE